ncbi:MAG: thiosulfate oxidation carrier complex protein SoxZ [Hyphomicrobium sp.]|jgi:sulfur-oxidizing protein SoxZ
MTNKSRIKLPDQAATGEVIEVKALTTHVMETGNRKDGDGKPIPRNIIHTFTARYAGELVFKAEFGSGIAANPFIAFYMRVPGPGEFEMTWTDDAGATTIERAPLNVA